MSQLVKIGQGWRSRVGIALLSIVPTVWAADTAPNLSSASLTPKANLSMAEIRALPDNTPVQLKSGRVVPAGRVKKLADAITTIRQSGLDSAKPSAEFSRTNGAAKVQILPGMSLREISKRPDSDVLQLPDGRKITVGDLKKLSELQRQRTGQALLDIQPKGRPSIEGPAIRINSRDELQKLSDKPDSTVLETRTGRRVTLGELRAYAKKNNKPLGARK